MIQNLGPTDRSVRVAAAIVAVVIAVEFPLPLGVFIALWALTAALVATAVVGYCPLYAPFHIHTN